MFFSCIVSVASTLNITIVTSRSEDRQSTERTFAGITVKTNRPVLRAVELAVYEPSTLFETLGVQARIHQLELHPDEDIQQQLDTISPLGFVILDLPLNLFAQVARFADQSKLVMANVRHSDSYLRESLCFENLFHTIPSDRMYVDALSQFLIYQIWRKVILAQGPEKCDEDLVHALYESLMSPERAMTLAFDSDIVVANLARAAG